MEVINKPKVQTLRIIKNSTLVTSLGLFPLLRNSYSSHLLLHWIVIYHNYTWRCWGWNPRALCMLGK